MPKVFKYTSLKQLSSYLNGMEHCILHAYFCMVYAVKQLVHNLTQLWVISEF